MPDSAVIALDIGVLLRLAGLDVQDGDPLFLSPFQQSFTDVFGAIINPYRLIGQVSFRVFFVAVSQCVVVFEVRSSNLPHNGAMLESLSM